MITIQSSSKATHLPLLRINEVAKILTVSRQSVKTLIDNGDLKAGKLNPSSKKKRVHVRVTRESLAKFYRKRFDRELATEAGAAVGVA